MGPRYSTILLDAGQREEVETLVPPGTFVVLSPAEFPSFIPNGIRTKCECAYIAASADPSGTTYLMCDLHRIDVKASCIDQEPLLATITLSGSQSVATFAHHGEWAGRSYKPPDNYWNTLRESGVGAYYGTNIPSNRKRGPLGDLPQQEQIAFESVINGIVKSSVTDSTG